MWWPGHNASASIDNRRRCSWSNASPSPVALLSADGARSAGLRSCALQEPQTERQEYQDNPDVYDQALPELVPEEQDVHADHDGYQREYVKHDGYLSHCFVLPTLVILASALIETDQSRRDHYARRSWLSVTLHVVLLAGLARATTMRRCRTLSRMSSVSSAALLKARDRLPSDPSPQPACAGGRLGDRSRRPAAAPRATARIASSPPATRRRNAAHERGNRRSR